MAIFLKLNGLSALYALVFFIQVELMMNVYRLERITGLTTTTINTYINFIILLIFVVSSIMFYLLTKYQLGNRMIKYITSVLWIPYFIVYIGIFVSLYPMTNPQEKPLGVMGIVVLGIAIIYPFYIAFVNFIASINFIDTIRTIKEDE